MHEGEHKFCDPEAAERAVIGLMMMRPEQSVPDAMFCVQAEDFAHPIRRAAFQAIIDMRAAERPLDSPAVSHWVSGVLRGEDYLKKFEAGKQTAADIWAEIGQCEYYGACSTSVEYYATVVVQHSRLRMLRAAAKSAATDATTVEEASMMLERAVAKAETPDSGRPENIGEVLSREHDAIAAEVEGRTTIHKVSVGLSAIDHHCGGMRGGEFWVFGARPGAGKTVLGWQVAEAVAFNSSMVSMFFSLEMSKSELARRMFARNSRSLTTTHIRHARIPQEAWADMQNTARDYADVPLLVIDEPRLTLPKIIASAERVAMVRPIGLIVIDYLQLIRTGAKFDNREQEVAHISRELKATARTLNTPVVALAQLNRAVENRASHNPQLSDLRESGAIEQDADTIVFIHRPFVFDQTANPEDAEFHIAKNRHVVGARLPVRFLGHKSLFIDTEVMAA